MASDEWRGNRPYFDLVIPTLIYCTHRQRLCSVCGSAILIASEVSLPFNPNTQPTAGSVLAGQQQQPQDPQQVGNTPLADRLADPSLLQQQQAAPQPPTPQQVVNEKHNALGKVTSFLFGHQVDPSTGEPVKQQPGAIFRSLLAGALLGGAVGREGKATGGSAGGYLTGLARGGMQFSNRATSVNSKPKERTTQAER